MLEVAIYENLNNKKILKIFDCHEVYFEDNKFCATCVKDGKSELLEFVSDLSTRIGVNGKSLPNATISDIVDLARDDIYLYGNKKVRLLIDFTIKQNKSGEEYNYINQLLYSLEN